MDGNRPWRKASAAAGTISGSDRRSSNSDARRLRKAFISVETKERNCVKNRIEAIHLAALAIDEVKARGSKRHALALATLEEGRRLWREQREPEKCTHCGKPL